MMRYFQKIFKPSNPATITLVESELDNIVADSKETPYETAMHLFTRVEKLEKERALIDGGSFDTIRQLHAVCASLGGLNDEIIISYTRMWKVQNFGTDTYDYPSFKDFLTAALLTEKQEEITRKRRQGESARAKYH
jgi:hypothetical protein